ncbi:MAG: UDP-N-acetylmuramate dehydrogenase [Proteobacteria bacterium]|nr:UDP-N-acetylmuramate dehydrogenase [Pseudomonadota bacterium]MBU4470899.1 UDP-N-acetylmuramate dehydrogenase [Pseudomonadota bacterium]MCG2751897.1 UDP-N-acetylmuramate dehydrogenase [Desulfobacteraceae bacterium]
MGISSENRIWLRRLFGEGVWFDEPMHRHTSFHIGGPADALVMPHDRTSLRELVEGCGTKGIPYFILGKGTNLLVKDKGIRGIVILLKKCLNKIAVAEIPGGACRVSAMAGVNLQRLCRFAIKKGLAGLNFAMGIPGSVGGAIAMNAGTADGAMGDVLESLDVLFPSGKNERLLRDRLFFSYRHFSIQSEDKTVEKAKPVILEGHFLLTPSDSELLKEEAEKRMKQRKATQPMDQHSPGCVFKNPEPGLSAGKLIDDAGLKGFRIGDAEISTRHGNYIINRGSAKAADVLELMQKIEDKVYEQHRVKLEPEIIFAGE